MGQYTKHQVQEGVWFLCRKCLGRGAGRGFLCRKVGGFLCTKGSRKGPGRVLLYKKGGSCWVSLLRVFDTAGYGRIRQETAGYGRIRQDTAGYGRIRQDTAGYGRIRQDTAGYGRIRQDTQDTAGYSRIRQDTADTAGYGRIRQDTAGYDRVQNICLFALRKQPFCVHSAFGGISYCSCMPIVTFPADNPLHVHQLFVSKKKKIATCFLSLVVFHPVPACPLCCFCLG